MKMEIRPFEASMSDVLQDVRSHSWFWCHSVILEMGLSVYEIAVYCVLARHADGSGEKRVCFPSYRRLSTVLGCSRPRAVQAVRILIQKGLLKKTARSDQKGCHSNLYELIDPVNASGTAHGKRGEPG
ncbi:MAG: helix-turn-helix domain-containing protein [Nitrospiria bacterium]